MEEIKPIIQGLDQPDSVEVEQQEERIKKKYKARTKPTIRRTKAQIEEARKKEVSKDGEGI